MRSRVADWQGALFQTFNDALNRPFSWDGWTCFDFAAVAYVAVTGKADPRESFPVHVTERAAYVALQRAGGPIAVLTRFLGEPIHPAMAQRGDIVLGDFGVGEQPAVCMGVKSFAPGPAGLLDVPTLSATLAWMI